MNGEEARRRDLTGRLAKAPDGDGHEFDVADALEGLVLIAIGIGAIVLGVHEHKLLYVAGGAGWLALLAVGAFFYFRGKRKSRNAVSAGEARVNHLWHPAHYCYSCDAVFCPGNTPWRGVLAPEQFKMLVWTEGGYADRLNGDKAHGAVVPPGTVPGP